MPRQRCVPHCTKKGYKDESGNKISHFQFPNDKTLKRKWLHFMLLGVKKESTLRFQTLPRYVPVILEKMIIENHCAFGSSVQHFAADGKPYIHNVD